MLKKIGYVALGFIAYPVALFVAAVVANRIEEAKYDPYALVACDTCATRVYRKEMSNHDRYHADLERAAA